MRDSIKRKCSIINRAKFNSLVNLLINDNYRLLYNLLVRTEEDKDIFNDTYLNLTSTYKPNRPFNVEFARLFNNLKIEYRKKDSQIKYISIDANFKESSQDLESVD